MRVSARQAAEFGPTFASERDEYSSPSYSLLGGNEAAPRLYAGTAADNNPVQAATPWDRADFEQALINSFAGSAGNTYESPYEAIAASGGDVPLVRRQVPTQADVRRVDNAIVAGVDGTAASIDELTGAQRAALQMGFGPRTPEAAAFVVARGGAVNDSGSASFQEINDRKVIAGTYDRFTEMGRAWSESRYGDLWGHLTFESSPQANTVTPTSTGPSFTQRLEMAIVLPPAIAMTAVATGGVFSALGSRFLTTQLALQPVPLAQLGTTELGKGMAFGGTASTILYGATRREEATPAGAATAFAAGAIGGGLVKQSLNAAALLPNTAIPFAYSNAVTQATGYAFGFGAVGWMNGPPGLSAYGSFTTSGTSWWTSPIFSPRPPEPPKPKP